MRRLLGISLLAGGLLAGTPAMADSFSLSISTGGYRHHHGCGHHCEPLSYYEIQRLLGRYGYCDFGGYSRHGDFYRFRARDRYGSDVDLHVNVFSGSIVRADYPKHGWGHHKDWDRHDGWKRGRGWDDHGHRGWDDRGRHRGWDRD